MTRVFETVGDYTDAVLEVVAMIPSGRVMTYGDVAWTFGRPGARAVGMVLSRYGSGTAWWRVVRAGGLPPAGHEVEARRHYEEEGTPLLPSHASADYRIDLPHAAWRPDPDALADDGAEVAGAPPS